MVVMDNMKTKYISKEYANELQQQLREFTKEKQELMDTLPYLKEQKSTGALVEDVGWQRSQDRLFIHSRSNLHDIEMFKARKNYAVANQQQHRSTWLKGSYISLIARLSIRL
ncbi:hypothetical protein BH23PAT2_BH23PAT2_02110 [soil metagenome]